MFSHYIPLPASVKQYLVDFIPNQGIKELKASVDFIDHMAREIYNAKRKALLSGDEALKQQVGEGKDIMSVLRVYFPFLQSDSLTSMQCGLTWRPPSKTDYPRMK